MRFSNRARFRLFTLTVPTDLGLSLDQLGAIRTPLMIASGDGFVAKREPPQNKGTRVLEGKPSRRPTKSEPVSSGSAIPRCRLAANGFKEWISESAACVECQPP